MLIYKYLYTYIHIGSRIRNSISLGSQDFPGYRKSRYSVRKPLLCGLRGNSEKKKLGLRRSDTYPMKLIFDEAMCRNWDRLPGDKLAILGQIIHVSTD